MVTLYGETEANRVFSSLDAAIEYGKQLCIHSFRVDKEMLEDLMETDPEKGILLGGHAEFRKDGTLISCSCYTLGETEFTILNGLEPSNFEEAYIPLLNPFEYGDIVRIIGDDRPAIVITQPKKHDTVIERNKHAKFPLNYYSNSITVEFLYPDGEFSLGHPNMLHLEQLDHWENELEWNLLQAVSKLMNGTGNIESVIGAYRANMHYST
jgi:hypothetical protein